MNERIKELAKQANIEFTYDPTETPIRAFTECWEDELEKFAELIVRECGQIAYSEEPDYGNKIRFMILEHFGVEE